MQEFNFQLWHLPIIFLAGFFWELYGSVVWWWSIVMQWVMLQLWLPLQNVIAIDNAAAIWTEVWVIKESKENILEYKKLIIFMFFPLFLGWIIGTYLLLVINPHVIKNLIVISISLLLIYQFLPKPKIKKISERNIKIIKYFFLWIFLIILWLYNNLIWIWEGAFSRIALISILWMSFVWTMWIKTTAILPIRIYSLIVTLSSWLIFLPYLLTLWVATFFGWMYWVRFAKKIPEKYLKIFLISIIIFYMIYLLFFYK
jgi:uncharacterized membrane protein YfcA